MTRDELAKIVAANTIGFNVLSAEMKSQKEVLLDQKVLLNDHIHAHGKMRFWLITFLVSTGITSFFSFLGTIIYLVIDKIK